MEQNHEGSFLQNAERQRLIVKKKIKEQNTRATFFFKYKYCKIYYSPIGQEIFSIQSAFVVVAKCNFAP